MKKLSERKVENACRVLKDGGYVIRTADGTLVPEPEEKKPIGKKGVAAIAAVVGGGLTAAAFGVARLLGGEHVSPDTVSEIAEAVADATPPLDEASEFADTFAEAIGS
jgi:6-phosphogluconate dehydrogenase (decarboxylating)